MRQRREQHHLVDAVAELGREPALQLALIFALHLLDADLPRAESERVRQLAEVLRAGVRRHDDDRVRQIHALAAAVGQPAFVERLQEQVQQARARLLDLVEQDDRARVVAQLVRQHAAALAADDAARHANQLVHRHAAVLVFGHVDADHLLLVAEQELGDGLGELGLADAGRAEEQQHAVRADRSRP